jgi:excisionase family DNA binding protein
MSLQIATLAAVDEDEGTSDDWWSVTQVAREFSVDPETVKRWIRRGRLKAAKPGGTRNSKWLIDQAEVDRLAAQR